jgi:hypothetical protein
MSDLMTRLRAYGAPLELALEVIAEIEGLRVALKECADRFERCIIATGTDKEHAVSAVERYRSLLTK